MNNIPPLETNASQTIVWVNAFLLGFSLALGLTVPKWVKCMTYLLVAIFSSFMVHYILR